MHADPVLAVEYRHEGCAVWPACLSCPLPVCAYEIANDPEHGAAVIRAELIKLLHRRGHDPATLARRFALSRRRVYAMLQIRTRRAA